VTPIKTDALTGSPPLIEVAVKGKRKTPEKAREK
jgi:hypothetical protein